MIVLYVLGVIAAIWFAFWAIVWIYWFLLGGNKGDKSGDATLGIVFLPVFPFIWVWFKVCDAVNWVRKHT